MEPHDLWLAKTIAGRPRDMEFCRALSSAGIVRSDELERRLGAVEGLDQAVRESIRERIEIG